MTSPIKTSILAAVGLSMAASPVLLSAAAAQDRGYDQGYDQDGPPPGYYDQGQGGGYYDQGQGGGYDRGGPPPPGAYGQGGYDRGGYGSQGQYAAAPPPPPPPPGYDGTRAPPPPPGYDARQYAPDPGADQRYASYAEDWAQRYCVKAHGNAGAGAVIGGIAGALIGGGIAGRHDFGVGVLAGGAVGAVGGAAIAGSSGSNATSPGCPPGFVVRGGAPVFAYEGYGSPYVYAAPGWYRPWYFAGGKWLYRPYPYHRFYAYRWHRGFYGRPGRVYGRGHRWHRGW